MFTFSFYGGIIIDISNHHLQYSYYFFQPLFVCFVERIQSVTVYIQNCLY